MSAGDRIHAVWGVREKWTDAAIKRIFRFVLDLFQPDYLSERSKTNKLAIQDEKSFKVNFSCFMLREHVMICSTYNFSKLSSGKILNDYKYFRHTKKEGILFWSKHNFVSID